MGPRKRHNLRYEKYDFMDGFLKTQWEVIDNERGNFDTADNASIDVVWDSFRMFLEYYGYSEDFCSKILLGKLLHKAGLEKVKRGPRGNQRFYYFPLKPRKGSLAETAVAVNDNAKYISKAKNNETDMQTFEQKNCENELVEDYQCAAMTHNGVDNVMQEFYTECEEMKENIVVSITPYASVDISTESSSKIENPQMTDNIPSTSTSLKVINETDTPEFFLPSTSEPQQQESLVMKRKRGRPKGSRNKSIKTEKSVEDECYIKKEMTGAETEKAPVSIKRSEGQPKSKKKLDLRRELSNDILQVQQNIEFCDYGANYNNNHCGNMFENTYEGYHQDPLMEVQVMKSTVSEWQSEFYGGQSETSSCLASYFSKTF